MSHVNYIEHVQIESLTSFVKIVVRRFAATSLTHLTKSEDHKLGPLKKAIFHGPTSWSIV